MWPNHRLIIITIIIRNSGIHLLLLNKKARKIRRICSQTAGHLEIVLSVATTPQPPENAAAIVDKLQNFRDSASHPIVCDMP